MRNNYDNINGIWYFMFDPYELKTIKDYEELHRKYWELIAKEYLTIKPRLVDITTMEPVVICCSCFACAYANKVKEKNKGMHGYICDFCPINDYRGSSMGCCDYGFPFNLWRITLYTGDPKILQENAYKIANLKFTEPEVNNNDINHEA